MLLGVARHARVAARGAAARTYVAPVREMKFLLHEVQKKCLFGKGECVQIFIDSCPLVGSKYPWFIRDATDAFGVVEQGEGDVRELENAQPY